MWNFFKKKNNNSDFNSKNMGFMERLAMKKIMSMSEKERTKLIEKLMSPENIEKNKDKINDMLLQMEASGRLSKEQIEEVRKKFNL